MKGCDVNYPSTFTGQSEKVMKTFKLDSPISLIRVEEPHGYKAEELPLQP